MAALPETACFGVPVIRPAGQDRCPIVMERHIAALPFYPFCQDSSIGSAQSMIDRQTAVFLHYWNAFCRLFIRTGRHRHQTGNTSNQAEDGQYSYFGLLIFYTAEQDNAPAVWEADIAKLLFYAYWHTALPTVGIDQQIGGQKSAGYFLSPQPRFRRPKKQPAPYFSLSDHPKPSIPCPKPISPPTGTSPIPTSPDTARNSACKAITPTS